MKRIANKQSQIQARRQWVRGLRNGEMGLESRMEGIIVHAKINFGLDQNLSRKSQSTDLLRQQGRENSVQHSADGGPVPTGESRLNGEGRRGDVDPVGAVGDELGDGIEEGGSWRCSAAPADGNDGGDGVVPGSFPRHSQGGSGPPRFQSQALVGRYF